jgi:hypothetical protein
MALLPAEAADLGYGHALHALGIESVLHFLELEVADDGFNLLHGLSFLGIGGRRARG